MLQAISKALFGSALDQSNPISNQTFSLENLLRFLEEQILFNNKSLVEVSEICLGTHDLSCGIEDRLFYNVVNELPSEIRSTFERWYKGNQEVLQEKIPELIEYAESLKRVGSVDSGDKIRDLAIKWALVPIIRDLDRDVPRGFKRAQERLDVIAAQIEGFSKFPVQNIPLVYLHKFIQKIVPKKTNQEEIQRYAGLLRPHIQKFLERNFFVENADYIQTLLKFPLSRNPEDNRKCFIWMHKEPKGLLLTFCPDLNTFRKRKDGLDEFVVTEVFIPIVENSTNHIPKAETSTLFRMNKDKESYVLKDLENRKSILSLPGTEKYFAPPPTIHFKSRFYVKNEAGYKSLQNELESSFKSLSPLDTLKVCQDVALGIQSLKNAGRVSLDIDPKNIAFKKEDDGTVLGKISRSLNLTPPGEISRTENLRLNSLAKAGFASFDSDCFSLILLLAETFFNLKSISRDSQRWERDILSQIEGFLYEPHMNKILDLKYKHGGFNEEFSRDVLGYAAELISSDEESFQIEILKQFALKMSFFEEIKSLLFTALEADRAHHEMISEGKSCEEILASSYKIPSLDLIQEVIQNAINKISSLEFEREPTNCTEIPLGSIEEFVQRVFSDPGKTGNSSQRAIDIPKVINDLHTILNDYLKESPYVGSEIRLHKDEIWKETGIPIPFSMWINISKDKVVLEVFPPDRRMPLGIGSFKKAKNNTQIEIGKDGMVTSTPIAISRLRDVNDWKFGVGKGTRLQEAILKIPGADRYFLELSKKHASYVSNGKVKQESVYPLFNGTLFSANHKQTLETEAGSYTINTSDFIDCLKRVGLGLALIAEKGISHSDIKTQNIAIILKEGTPLSYVFDFDVASNFEEPHKDEKYWVWNAMRQDFGICSKETDLYGYVLVIAESLIFGFSEFIQGDNERIIGNLKRVCENSSEINRELRLKYAEKMQRRFPDLITDDRVLFFSNPHQNGEIKSEHFKVIEHIKTLQVQGNESDALILKRFLVQSLFFDKVFGLLSKTLFADKVSKSFMDSNLEQQEDFYQAALKALKLSNFPELDEVQGVLDYCKGVVEEVDQYCNDQPGLIESITAWFKWS
jgi:hypothetical protein